MSTPRTLIAGAAIALAVTLGASAPALADFNHGWNWAPSPPPPHAGQRHAPPTYGQRNMHGWVWVCRHHDCGWVRETRRYAPPHYAQPAPYRRLPPVAWQQPLGTIYLQLNF